KNGPDEPDDVAFWDMDFLGSGTYTGFWENAVKWAMRSEEAGRFLDMRMHVDEGKVKVVIHAFDKEPLTNVKFEVGLTNPSFRGADGKRPDIQFEQVAP